MNEDYVFDTERTIIYRMYEDSPGMIYYEFRYKDPEKQKAYELSRSKETSEMDEELINLAILTLMASATTAETMAELGEAMVNGLLFLLVPRFELDSIKQRYTGGCYAAV